VKRVFFLERRKKDVSSRRNSTYGYATRSIAKGMEEKSGIHSIMKSAGVLWRGHPR